MSSLDVEPKCTQNLEMIAFDQLFLNWCCHEFLNLPAIYILFQHGHSYKSLYTCKIIELLYFVIFSRC